MDYGELDRTYISIVYWQRCFCGRKTNQYAYLFGKRMAICGDCWPFVRYNLGPDSAIAGVGVFFEDGDWHLSFSRCMGFDAALKVLPDEIADAFRPVASP